MDIINPERLTIVDLETGGLVKEKHPIIQIGAVAVGEGLEEVERFEVKVKFKEDNCDPEALELSCYDPAVWEEQAVGPKAAAKMFADFLGRHRAVRVPKKSGNGYWGGAQLSGYNFLKFDGPFLSHWYRVRLKAPGAKYGPFLPANYTGLCVMDLFHWYVWANRYQQDIPNLRLETACKHFGIGEGDQKHDALDDALRTAEVARNVCQELGVLDYIQDVAATVAALAEKGVANGPVDETARDGAGQETAY